MYITPIFDGYYLNEIAHIYKSHLQIQTKKQVENKKYQQKNPTSLQGQIIYYQHKLKLLIQIREGKTSKQQLNVDIGVPT